jgi:hypothetical protein
MSITDTALILGTKWGFPLKKTLAEHATDRERREVERAIAYWEDKVGALGQNATVAALDLDAINSVDWSHRFLIAVDQRIERSVLLLYGAEFARLLDLPPKVQPSLPMGQQLPRRFSEVFLLGCAEAPTQMVPVRLDGQVERDDQRIERYRAVFIPVGVRPNSLTHFAFLVPLRRCRSPSVNPVQESAAGASHTAPRAALGVRVDFDRSLSSARIG